MNIAFQIEALTNSDGNREVVAIECDPTTEPANDALDASEIDEGAWEFRFVVVDDFDGSEPVFKRFERNAWTDWLLFSWITATIWSRWTA